MSIYNITAPSLVSSSPTIIGSLFQRYKAHFIKIENQAICCKFPTSISTQSTWRHVHAMNDFPLMKISPIPVLLEKDKFEHNPYPVTSYVSGSDKMNQLLMFHMCATHAQTQTNVVESQTNVMQNKYI